MSAYLKNLSRLYKGNKHLYAPHRLNFLVYVHFKLLLALPRATVLFRYIDTFTINILKVQNILSLLAIYIYTTIPF